MKSYKFIILYIFFITLVLSFCSREETPLTKQEDLFYFKVQFFLGDVKIIKGSAEQPAAQGDMLKEGDIIITGKKSTADLIFGASGVIRINENSRVTVAGIARKAGDETLLDMENGKLFLTLAKLEGTQFKVKTPTAVASVRGTSFTVTTDRRGAKLAVMNGSVSVSPVLDGNIIENRSSDVDAGNRTDYIDRKTAERIVNNNIEIPVLPLTVSEKLEIINDIKIMKLDEIPDLTLEIKENIQQLIAMGPAPLEDRIPGKKPEVKKEDREAILRKQAEEEKRREEEQQRKAEEKRKKEEQVKKERVSNIPTL